jgi:enoyl-CoA hydratase/carnithine racemase
VSVLEALEKPTIAAIHGYALGGGLELSLGADFRFLAEDALVGQPEIKLGLIPGAGGTQRLSRVVGFQKAKDIVFTGRQVGAQEAMAIGLADRVYPTEQLLEESLQAAAEMATWPTRAITAAKRALAGGWGRPLDDGMAVEEREFETSFWSEDAREGVAAFLEKRGPNFQGR